MPIPKPKANETENEFVSRCISEIFDEYGQEQSAAICYNTYRKETNMGTQEKIASKLRQDAFRGIDLTKLQEDGLEDACWDGWKALGTKVIGNTTVPNCIPEEDHPDFK